MSHRLPCKSGPSQKSLAAPQPTKPRQIARASTGQRKRHSGRATIRCYCRHRQHRCSALRRIPSITWANSAITCYVCSFQKYSERRKAGCARIFSPESSDGRCRRSQGGGSECRLRYRLAHGHGATARCRRASAGSWWPFSFTLMSSGMGAPPTARGSTPKPHATLRRERQICDAAGATAVHTWLSVLGVAESVVCESAKSDWQSSKFVSPPGASAKGQPLQMPACRTFQNAASSGLRGENSAASNQVARFQNVRLPLQLLEKSKA